MASLYGCWRRNAFKGYKWEPFFSNQRLNLKDGLFHLYLQDKANAMTVHHIYSKINLLQEERMAELLVFVEYLLNKEKETTGKFPKNTRKPKFGSAKGTFVMAKDFDEPIDHFNDYMP